MQDILPAQGVFANRYAVAIAALGTLTPAGKAKPNPAGNPVPQMRAAMYDDPATCICTSYRAIHPSTAIHKRAATRRPALGTQKRAVSITRPASCSANFGRRMTIGAIACRCLLV